MFTDAQLCTYMHVINQFFYGYKIFHLVNFIFLMWDTIPYTVGIKVLLAANLYQEKLPETA